MNRFLDTIQPAILGFVTSALILAGHPILGAFLLSTYCWLQFRSWKRQEEKLTLQKDLLSWLATAELCELDARQFEQFQIALHKVHNYLSVNEVEIIVNTLIQSFQFRREIEKEANKPPSFCQNCFYYHGKDAIVCAVHPTGYGDDNCPDWKSPNKLTENNL